MSPRPISLGPIALLAVVGCKEPPAPDYTEDIRVDGASTQNDPDSFGTRMCVVEDGSSAVVYVLFMDDRDQPGEGRDDIWLNRSLDLGKTWLPAPIKVNQGNPDLPSNTANAELACSPDGVFVVWEDDRDGELRNHQIYFNRSVDRGLSFMPEDILLERDFLGEGSSLSPKIRAQGPDLFVVWEDNINGAFDIYVASSNDAGASWRSPLRVDSDNPGTAYSGQADLLIGRSASDIWVVWEDRRAGASDIYFARSDDGGVSFEPDERLDLGDDEGATSSFAPRLCSDGSGHLYAVWHDARGGEGHDILMNYSYDNGAHWFPAAVRLDSDAPGLGNSEAPVCVAQDANLHVIWQDKRQSDYGYDIYHRTATAGIPGASETRLDVGIPQEGHADSVLPQIAFDGTTLLVGWRDTRGEVLAGREDGNEDLYYNYARLGGPFDTTTDYRIDSMLDGGSYKEDLNIEVLGGTWLAAWTDGRLGTGDVFYQSFPLGEASDPPTEDEFAL